MSDICYSLNVDPINKTVGFNNIPAQLIPIKKAMTDCGIEQGTVRDEG